jgi:hypothetical protein
MITVIHATAWISAIALLGMAVVPSHQRVGFIAALIMLGLAVLSGPLSPIAAVAAAWHPEQAIGGTFANDNLLEAQRKH